jgi:hypothetical protein
VKDGACAKCGQKVVKAEYCVRTATLYVPSCHPEKASDKPVMCDGKLFNTPSKVTDRARLTYECETCKASADLESDFKHADDCKKKSSSPRKVCPKSGTPPHSK